MLSHKILEKTSVGNSVPTVVGVFNILFYFFLGGRGFSVSWVFGQVLNDQLQDQVDHCHNLNVDTVAQREQAT